MACDGFKMVTAKKQARATVQCAKPGCTGSCPVNVVRRSNQKDGVPAKCLVCNRRYKVPPGTEQQAKPAGSRDHSAVHKELLALKKELADFKAAKAPCDIPPTGSQANEKAFALSDDDKAAVRAVQKQIQQLKELGPELRASLCDPRGGYEAFVASLEDKRQAIFTKHRGTMPLDVQRQKSQQFLKGVQKQRDDAESALTELQRQSNDLQEKVARQTQCLAEAEIKLQSAKLEAATIAQAAEQHVTPAAVSVDQASQGQASLVTAQAVKGFFQTLPSMVAEHPEGIEAVKQVMALLEKLDSAAKLAGASDQEKADAPAGPLSQTHSRADEDMQLDDELLDQMAEAATAPAGEGEGEAEARKVRVSEAKDRLRSKKKDLEVGLAKVRKTGKK
jgi:DNA repair exonuclease SbcCD ATPase subunit